MADAPSRVSTLRVQLRFLLDSLAASEKRAVEADARREQALHAVEEAQRQLKRTQAACETSAVTQQSQAQIDLERAKVRIAELEMQLGKENLGRDQSSTAARQQVLDLQAQLNAQSIEITELRLELERRNNALRHIEETHRAQQNEVLAACREQRRCRALERQVQSLAAVASQSTLLEEELRGANAKIERLESVQASAIAGEQRLRQAELAVGQWRSALQQASGDSGHDDPEALAHFVRSLKAKDEELRKELSRLAIIIQTLTDENAMLEASASRNRIAITEAKTHATALQRQLDMASANEACLTLEVNGLREILSAYESERGQSEPDAAMQQMKKRCEVAEAALEALKADAASLRATANDVVGLRELCANLSRQNAELRSSAPKGNHSTNAVPL